MNLTTLIGGNIGTWLFGIKDTALIWFAMLGLVLYPAFIWLMTSFLSFQIIGLLVKRKINIILKILLAFLEKEISGFCCC
ncbi:hypothetical protein L2503_12280 [Lactobacillus crispatus]|nr:hypothetical protein [Lactobacillus crispatus]